MPRAQQSSSELGREAAFQKKHYSIAEAQRFDWQTKHPVISRKERDLVTPLGESIRRTKAKTVLEVGCGEGANLFHLRKMLGKKTPKIFAIDYGQDKIDFASHHDPQTKYVCMDGTKLAYASNSFDIVFLRDVIHHVPDRDKLISEALRVSKKEVVIVETNGRSPIIWVFSHLVRVERGMRQSTVQNIQKLLLRNGARTVSYSYLEASSIPKIIFHYRWGFEKLGNVVLFRTLSEWSDAIVKFLLPKMFWSYAAYVAKK